MDDDHKHGYSFRTGRGFSLIEVLISVTVLAIVVLTVFSVLVYGFGALMRTRQVTLATQICQEQVDYVRNRAFASIPSLGSTFTNPKLGQLREGVGSLAVEDIDPVGNDLLKLSVSVRWRFRGQDLHKDVVTFIARRGIDKE